MQTVIFKNKPSIISTGTIAGPKERAGLVGNLVDKCLDNDMFGEETFEKAECKMLSYAIYKAISNCNKREEQIDLLIAGDLLNQIVSASFSARKFNIPYLGVYGACSTMVESMIIASNFVNSGLYDNVLCATGSHFSSAERQYRYPLELGCTRPPQSQWTVTGAGACVISKKGNGPKITMATIGKVVDFGITDANNMGAAMAPAACDTIIKHFEDTKLKPSDYDLIVTGDLGTFGSRILKDLTWEKGLDIEKQHVDCGELIYNIAEKEFQGGSGAGCSAVIFNSYLYKKLLNKEINKILFVATGALLSSVTTQQGESIPGIAHAVTVEN